MPFTGFAVFLAIWLVLLIGTLAYSIIIFQSAMYIVGMCSYVTTMGNDLSKALNDIDESFRVSARTSDHQAALRKEVHFHVEVIE